MTHDRGDPASPSGASRADALPEPAAQSRPSVTPPIARWIVERLPAEKVECVHFIDSVDIDINQFAEQPIVIELYDGGRPYVDQGVDVSLWFGPDQARAFAAQLIKYADSVRPASGIVTREGGDAPAAPGAKRVEPGGEAATPNLSVKAVP